MITTIYLVTIVITTHSYLFSFFSLVRPLDIYSLSKLQAYIIIYQSPRYTLGLQKFTL